MTKRHELTPPIYCSSIGSVAFARGPGCPGVGRGVELAVLDRSDELATISGGGDGVPASVDVARGPDRANAYARAKVPGVDRLARVLRELPAACAHAGDPHDIARVRCRWQRNCHLTGAGQHVPGIRVCLLCGADDHLPLTGRTDRIGAGREGL